MWVVRDLYWRNGQLKVNASKNFDNFEDAKKFRDTLNTCSEIYETSKAGKDFGQFNFGQLKE